MRERTSGAQQDSSSEQAAIGIGRAKEDTPDPQHSLADAKVLEEDLYHVVLQPEESEAFRRTRTPKVHELVEAIAANKLVVIRHAIFDEPVEIEGGTVARRLNIEHCTFLKGCTLRGIAFQDQVSLSHSHFHGPLIIRACTTSSELMLDGVRCEESALISMSTINGTFSAQGCKFKNGITVEGCQLLGPVLMLATHVERLPLLFVVVTFGQYVNLSQLRLEAGMNASHAVFGGILLLTKVRSAGELNLHAVTVNGQCHLDGASLGAPLSLSAAVLRGGLSAKNVLTTRKGKIDLSYAAVEGFVAVVDSRLRGGFAAHYTTFRGQVFLTGASDRRRRQRVAFIDLFSARVRGNLHVSGLTIEGPGRDGGVRFRMNRLSVEGSCTLTQINVLGDVTADEAHFFGSLLIGTPFDSESSWEKRDVEIEGSMSLTGAQFTDSLQVAGVHIGRRLSGVNLLVRRGMELYHVDAKEEISFDRAIVEGECGLIVRTASSLNFRVAIVRRVFRVLSGTSCKGGFNCAWARFEQELNLGGLEPSSAVDLSRARIGRAISFVQTSHDAAIDLVNADRRMTLDLRETTYETIEMLACDARHVEALLSRVQPYSRSTHLRIEETLRASGHGELAGLVRRHWNQLEMASLEYWSTKYPGPLPRAHVMRLLGWFWRWTLGVTTGYGSRIGGVVVFTILLMVVKSIVEMPIIAENLVSGLILVTLAILGDTVRRRLYPHSG